MEAFAVPLVSGKEAAWEAWTAELNGPRKTEFDAFNDRYGLSAHRAWLQGTPDGGRLVIVVLDGPGAGDFMGKVGASDNEFDRWFGGKVSEFHGVDLSGPLPPPAERKL